MNVTPDLGFPSFAIFQLISSDKCIYKDHYCYALKLVKCIIGQCEYNSVEMALQHDALERRASALDLVRNHLKRTGHSLEFYPEECLGLVSGRIRHWIKKAFHCLALGNASKFERDFDVELHGTLM